jgi:hypothetical protein
LSAPLFLSTKPLAYQPKCENCETKPILKLLAFR